MSFIEKTGKEIDRLNSTGVIRYMGYIDENNPSKRWGKLFYNIRSNRGKTVCPFTKYSHKRGSQFIYFDEGFGTFTIKCRHQDCKHQKIQGKMVHYNPPYFDF